MQRRLASTLSTPAGSGPVLLRCFDAGPRRGFADVQQQRHPHLGINLVLHGSGILQADGQRHELRPGTVFLRRPEQPHSTAMSADYGELSIGFAPVHLPALAALGLPPEHGWVFPAQPWAGAVAAMRALMQRFDEGRDHAALLLAAAALAAEFLGRTRSHAPAAVIAARAAIDADPAHALSLPALARRVGMAPEALRAAFRRHYGLGPMAYRQQRRLDLALSMLEQHSVGTVAHNLGYGSADAFAAHFKRHFGIPPSRA